MNIEIPDDIMRATYPTPTELRVEIAVMPFEEEKLHPVGHGMRAELGRLARSDQVVHSSTAEVEVSVRANP